MFKQNIFILILLLCMSCSSSVIVTDEEKEQYPDIFPDYINCTIPPNIAPLNFSLKTEYDEARVLLTSGDNVVEVTARKQQFSFPASQWKKILQTSMGKNIEVKVLAKENGKWVGYAPFYFHVAAEPIDPYMAYRLIEPGYELWSEMGIYQRNLENFTETPVLENKMTESNCMNCHSFCMQDPEKMMFHMRGSLACTMLIDGDKVEKLNTKTDQTMSTLVYPSWHPSGQYIAYSINDTKQAFHMNDPNRVEVYDNKSDVVVYDIKKHEIITTAVLFSEDYMETFPTFSPDGKTLYFCSAKTFPMPSEFENMKYSLCAISFDPETRRFGSQVDTLYNAVSEGQSISFPRVSPDGKYLLYTKSGYGTFSIWHKDSDLYMIDLATGIHTPLNEANSENVDSYHSWSSNSKWVAFSSRRIDGLYTRPYFMYIDADGKAAKPFLLPQKDVSFYHRFMKSYNIPELITGKVKNRGWQFARIAKEDPGVNVGFAGIK